MMFQKLHDSEINFQVSSFFDGEFTVRLGDEMNGWLAEKIVSSWDEVPECLKALAIQHFPDSDFARQQ